MSTGAHGANEAVTTTLGDQTMEAPLGGAIVPATDRPSGDGSAERAADRAAMRAFRPRRTVPAVVVAALLTVLGVVVAAQTISALAGRPLRWARLDRMLSWAASTPWNNSLFLLGAALVALVGLALLVAALVPGRPRLVPVRTGDPDLIIGMRRRSFARALAHAAEGVPGVHAARASVRGHTAAVTATTAGWDRERFGADVRTAVLSRLVALSPVESYHVKVNVRERK
jgi:hypothetical protein